jgi:hypothetical protein
VPLGPDQFARPAGGALLQVARDAQAAVVGATLQQGGRVFKGARSPTPERVPQAFLSLMPPGVADAFVGHYTVVRAFRSNIPLRVRNMEGQLLVTGVSFRPQPVFPIPGLTDRFQYENVEAQLQFERDAQGRVSGFTLRENGELRATRDKAATAEQANSHRPGLQLPPSPGVSTWQQCRAD